MLNNGEVLLWCLQQNYHLDCSNAAVHCAPVKFSPITFRILQALVALWPEGEDITAEMAHVRSHINQYVEDAGR